MPLASTSRLVGNRCTGKRAPCVRINLLVLELPPLASPSPLAVADPTTRHGVAALYTQRSTMAAGAAAAGAGAGEVPAGCTPLPPVARLSARVITILGGNPGPFTLQGSNVYLVGTGRARLLVDTADGRAAFLAAVADVLAAEGAVIDTILITHSHADHVGGIGGLVAAAAAAGAPLPTLAGAPPDTPYTLPPGVTWRPLAHGDVVAVEGATLSVLATPGHTRDSIAAVLAEERAAFVGDCVLGQGSCTFAHLRSYEASLRLLLAGA